MRGLTWKRRLRVLLACLVLSLAVAPPLIGVGNPPAATLVSAAYSGARSGVPGGSAYERTAQAIGARRQAPIRSNEASAALPAGRALHGSSREAAFDGRRLYLVHLALLC